MEHDKIYSPLNPPDPHTPGHLSKMIFIVLSAVTLVTICISSFLGWKLSALDTRLQDIQADNEMLTLQAKQLLSEKDAIALQFEQLSLAYSNTSSELAFWRSTAVVVTTTGKKYHTYNCPHSADTLFYIYNLSAAIDREYTRCLDCDAPSEPGIITRYGDNTSNNQETSSTNGESTALEFIESVVGRKLTPQEAILWITNGVLPVHSP